MGLVGVQVVVSVRIDQVEHVAVFIPMVILILGLLEGLVTAAVLSLMALGLSWHSFGTILSLRALEWFVAISMTLLGIQKLQIVQSHFSWLRLPAKNKALRASKLL